MKTLKYLKYPEPSIFRRILNFKNQSEQLSAMTSTLQTLQFYSASIFKRNESYIDFMLSCPR